MRHKRASCMSEHGPSDSARNRRDSPAGDSQCEAELGADLRPSRAALHKERNGTQAPVLRSCRLAMSGSHSMPPQSKHGLWIAPPCPTRSLKSTHTAKVEASHHSPPFRRYVTELGTGLRVGLGHSIALVRESRLLLSQAWE